MTSDRHKPRRPEPPPGSDVEIRRLHEKIQEARDATKEIRAALAEFAELTDRFAQLGDRIIEQCSEETIKARIEPLLSEDAIKERTEPVIGGIVDRLIETGETTCEAAQEAISKRWTQLIDHIAKMLGTKNKADLIKAISDQVVVDVAESANRINRSHREQIEAVRDLTEVMPDIMKVFNNPESPPPPPPPPPRRRSHSRNQGRRR